MILILARTNMSKEPKKKKGIKRTRAWTKGNSRWAESFWVEGQSVGLFPHSISWTPRIKSPIARSPEWATWLGWSAYTFTSWVTCASEVFPGCTAPRFRWHLYVRIVLTGVDGCLWNLNPNTTLSFALLGIFFCPIPRIVYFYFKIHQVKRHLAPSFTLSFIHSFIHSLSHSFMHPARDWLSWASPEWPNLEAAARK